MILELHQGALNCCDLVFPGGGAQGKETMSKWVDFLNEPSKTQNQIHWTVSSFPFIFVHQLIAILFAIWDAITHQPKQNLSGNKKLPLSLKSRGTHTFKAFLFIEYQQLMFNINRCSYKAVRFKAWSKNWCKERRNLGKGKWQTPHYCFKDQELQQIFFSVIGKKVGQIQKDWKRWKRMRSNSRYLFWSSRCSFYPLNM